MPDANMVEKMWSRNERLRAALELERSTFLSHWRELSDFLLPRRSRFTITDVNRGERRNQKIIDSTATLALRTLRSGMMAGVTSPSRPWFRLTTPDPSLAEFMPVKVWLQSVTTRMEDVFRQSNLYNSLPILYGDLGCFATAAMYIEEDFTGDVIRTMTLPIGSYSIATNERHAVDIIVREFQMTVRQIVAKFGDQGRDWSAISSYIKDLWERGQRDAWVQVVHIIQPNDDHDPSKAVGKAKRYRSTYYERGLSSQNATSYLADTMKDTALLEEGYDEFPVLCPRWDVTGEDVYGTACPGMDSLGDIKQLQLGEKRIMQAIEKSINPPTTGPSTLKSTKASILPGDVTYLDVREGQQGFRPVYQIDPRIQELEAKQEQVRQRIRRAFFEDLFLMLAASDRREITAREVEERHEEKLLALGPVMEQLNQDLFDPLIDVTFSIMVKQGMVPPPPPDLAGMKLKVEYVSVMAQAQKMVGLAGIERTVAFVGEIGKVVPEALDKLDLDRIIDSYADRNAVDPTLLRSEEAVGEVREARAKAAQAAATLQAIEQGAGAAKDLAGADMEKDSMLKRLVGAEA